MRSLQSMWIRYGSAVAAALCILAFAFFAYQLYCAWAYEAVWAFSRRGSSEWITHQGSPRWFVFTVITHACFALLTGVLVGLGMVTWRAERREFARRESRPRLDDAIRQSPEER